MRARARTRPLILIAAVVVVAGGGGGAYAAMSSAGPDYRLAAVTTATVTASLHEEGSLTPGQADSLAFNADGTIARVDVRAGQQVRAGQVLGTLDTTDLTGSLTQAQSALANARLKVANDVASQDSAAGEAAGPPPAGPSPQPSPSASPAAPSLAKLQQAVLTSQRQADTALTRAQADQAQSAKACAPTPSPSPSPSASSPASPHPAASASPSPASAPPASCAAATKQVLTAETAVLKDLQSLSARESALAAALSQASAAGTDADSGNSTGDDDTAAAGGGTPAAAAGPAGQVSAAQLAADQKAADAAAAQVTVAQQNLDGATVRSPVSGTVVSVTAVPGADASPGGTEFEVAELNSWQAQASVPVADMPQLKTGQQASVLPDGSSTALPGSVATIGLAPGPKANPVTYPVTIALAGQPAGLHQGDFAAVTITTARTSGVSVPTSAVHYNGTSATVTVYAGGKTRLVRVAVGTRGPVFTRITSGLRAGQQVVLANLRAPLPVRKPGQPVPVGPGFFAG